MATGEKVGSECTLLVSTGNTNFGATLVPYVRTNEFDCDANAIDNSSRANLGWGSMRPGLKRWKASFDMIYNSADSAWILLQQAFFAGTKIGVSILDGPAGVGLGINGPAYVMSFKRGEPLDGVVTTTVTLNSAGLPTWGSNS